MSRLEAPILLDKQIIARDWVRRRLGSVAHELRVARVAKMLFSLTRRWHGLGAADCRLLVLGALIHDVGRCMGDKKHAHNGAQMVMKDRWLPLSETERRRVAYLTRYHKSNVPDPGKDDILNPDLDDTSTMHILLALLRAADGLDSRTQGGPNLVVTLHGRIVQIHGYVEMDIDRAAHLFGRGKKMALLEQVLNCQVKTEWFSTEIGLLVS